MIALCIVRWPFVSWSSSLLGKSGSLHAPGWLSGIENVFAISEKLSRCLKADAVSNLKAGAVSEQR